MIELHNLLTFSLAAFVVIIAPGPVVTVVIANSLRNGVAAGLATVAGSLLGLAILIGLVVLGLGAAAAAFADLFEWIRILGAAYLIWLGVKLIRSGLRPDGAQGAVEVGARGFFAQGFLMAISNPKTLLFFGAFLPQFIDPAAGDATMQAALLGLVFTVIAGVSDSAYAFAAGRAGGWLRRRRRVVELGSGGFMVAGGLWMALRGRI